MSSLLSSPHKEKSSDILMSSPKKKTSPMMSSSPTKNTSIMMSSSPKKKTSSSTRISKTKKSANPKFNDQDIDARILKNIDFEEMTASQALYLPGILNDLNKSVFVNAGTGSGKTLGFLIPIMNKILRKKDAGGVSALIITPTGSLANQIYQEAKKLSNGIQGIKVEMIIKDRNVSADSIISSDIIVATPGRLGKMLAQQDVSHSMSQLDTFVLDEADSLARGDFMQVIGPIIKQYASVPATQKLFFSATKNGEIEKLLTANSMETVTAMIAKDMEQTNVQQFYHMYNPACLHEAIKVELQARCLVPNYKILVFLPTKFSVTYFTKVMRTYLSTFEGAPEILSVMGGMDPKQKEIAEDKFRNNTEAILFTTDMLARGMDFKNVTCVIMVGASDMDAYKQKNGRTGRAGQLGQSVILLGMDEDKYLEKLKVAHPNLKAVSDDVTKKTSKCAALENIVDEKMAKTVFKTLRGHYKPLIKMLGWKKEDVDKHMEARLQGLYNGST